MNTKCPGKTVQAWWAVEFTQTWTTDRGSRIRCDSSQPSHGSLAFSRCLPLPPLPFAPILSLKKSWMGRRALSEARRNKWHQENGKKSKENNMPWQQPHCCKPAAFWARLGVPQPFLHLPCLHVSGSCPAALPAATGSCCRGTEAALRAGSARFMHSKKRALPERASGSQRPGQENWWFISRSFHVAVVLSALLDDWVVFCSFITKGVQVYPKGATSNELDLTQLFC